MAVLWIAIVQNWSVYDVILSFWMENVVIGCFSIPKILKAQKDHPGKAPSTPQIKILTASIFCFHYSFFALLHLAWITYTFGPDYPGKTIGSISIQWDMYLLIGVGFLVIGHLTSFISNYLKKKEYQKVSPYQMMMLPYLRVFLVHFYLIVAGYFLFNLDEPSTALMVLFMTLKTVVDLLSHLAVHKIIKNL